jgi:hypothetical protein
LVLGAEDLLLLSVHPGACSPEEHQDSSDHIILRRLLCSEDKPHHCHRRLVVDYLKNRWGDVDIVHL